MKKKIALLLLFLIIVGSFAGSFQNVNASLSEDAGLSVFTINDTNVIKLPGLEILDPVNDQGAFLEISDFANFGGIIVALLPEAEIVNTYQNVNWSTFQQYKANLHTHTTYSDGIKPPHERIDEYYNNGYRILSLTDHDTSNPSGPLLYPWSNLSNINLNWENRIPEALNMVAVSGVEITAGRHFLSHFNDFVGEGSADEEYVLSQIEARNGLAHFVHPGRYTYNNPNILVSWYADKYKMFDCLVGMEVYNGRDLFPNDRHFWDNVLMETLPNKAVWAFGNDDNHVSSISIDFLLSWNIFILNDLNLENVKKAYENGTLFACNKNSALAPNPPTINSIQLEDDILTINASGYDNIAWIADGDEIGVGDSIDLSTIKYNNKYVRAKVIKTDRLYQGRTLTQPFYFIHRESNATSTVSVNGFPVDENQLATLPLSEGDEIIVAIISEHGAPIKHYKVTILKRTTPSLSLGDVNGDGVIDVIDVTLAIQHALGLTRLSDDQMAAADVNNDGLINVLDVNLIMQYTLDLINSFT
jgi:hypothetical protein